MVKILKSRINKIYLSTFLFFLGFSFLSYLLNSIGGKAYVNSPTFNKESILYELMKFNYYSFLKIGLLCLVITSFIIYIGFSFCVNFCKMNAVRLEQYTYTTAKILSSVSIIIPMTIVFNREQFNVVTTYLSFLALFSFAVPKFRNNNADSNATNNKDECNKS